MTVRLLLAVVIGVAVLAAGCRPQPAAPERWVVESVGYHGPRGGGVHYVTCVPIGDPDRWREVRVSAAVADSVDEGAPCPPGPVLSGSDPTDTGRTDGPGATGMGAKP